MGDNYANTSPTAVPNWASAAMKSFSSFGMNTNTPQTAGRRKRKSKKTSRKAGKKSRRRRKQKVFGMNIF
jgi:hypothetical protein